MDSNLSRHFGSARSAHSYDRHISSQSALSSFVTINQKRSWRPPPYLFQPVLDYMLDAAPLALAAANPFLRLYVERNENNGGFRLDGYQVTPLTLEQHHVACECGEGTAVRNEYGESGGLASLEDDSEGRSCGWNVYAGPYRGTSGMVAEEDGVGCGWGVEDGEESLREDSSDPRLSGDVNGGVRLIPLFLHGLGPSSGLSQASDHRYPAVGVDRVLPASTRSVVMSVKSNAPFATDARDRGCLGECWRSTAAELSLCVRVECKSQAALHFATLGAWWLSRYYGVSLRLQHMHPAQLASFKEVQRALFIKELHFEYCILSEDFIQCISTCVDLLSLSIISCSASQEVTLRCIDSILRKGNSESRLATAPSANIFDSGDGVSSADGEPPRSGLYGSSRATSAGGGGAGIGNGGGGSAAADFRREVSNWYLSGVRSLGSLRRLRCLHILHTPLHETFLQAIATCSSLECVILHRCRGVRSLEALQQLKRLQSLSLHGLSITDTDALSLGSFPALRQLVLDECRNVTDLSFLSRLRSTLERLFVPRTLLSNANMQHVGMLENLAELDVHSLRQLTELDALKDLTSLRALNARDNLITNQGCAALRLLPSVQRLDLSCCRCLTSLAAVFGDNGKWAQRLHSLNLSQTVVTDEGLHCLKECTELRYLNLSQCTAVQRLDFLRRMSALRWLHLGGTSIAAEEADRHLGSARSLRLLSLAGCGKMTSLRFATQLHHLEYLDLELTGVTDEQLEHLRGCRRLRFLSLQRCTSICWVVVLAELPALLELNISMTSVESSVRKLDSIYDNGQQRRVARSEGTSLASSYARMPSPPSPLSPTSPPTTSAPCSPRTEVPVTPNVRFASVQVLHLNGCGRVTRLDTFVRSFPQLRILYADRISIAAMRGVVGFGYAGIDELRRTRIGPRHRGVRVNVEADAEDDRDDSDEPTSAERKSEKWGRVGGASVLRQVPLGANKSVSQLDQVLQQHVPQPPSSPRPRTAHSVGSRPGAHGQLFAAMPPAERGVAGEASRLLRLVLRRSSITDTILASLCANLCCVTALDLTKCTDVQSLTGISMLYALRELFLTQSSVDNNGVVAVSACVSLEVLRLTECRNVTDVNCLSSLGKLRALSMERTHVTSPGFVGVGGCRSLQFLTCSECRFLSDVNTLGSLQRLQELHLELTDVRDAGIRGLLKCSALQRVYFTRCKRLTTVGDMRAVLPQLEVLDVYGTSIPTRVAGQGQQFACAVM